MSYIGNTNTTQGFTPAIDYFSGNASTTAFTLSRPVASVAQVQAVVNNVAQNPSDAFTVSGNTITFTSAPSSGTNNIYVYYTSPITQVIALGQNTVGLTALTAIGTPSSSTFLRGDNAWAGLSAADISSGTLAKARLPAGSVLQVVQTVKSDTFSSSSVTFVDITGMSVTITPTSASSKIFVDLVVSCGAPGCTPRFLVLRGSTSIGIGDANSSRQRASFGTGWSGDLNQMTNMSWKFLDSPATTSATTYKVQGLTDGLTFYINRSSSYPDNATLGISVISTITAWEIAT